MLNGKAQGVYSELQALAKKSSNDLINPFKLRLINQCLDNLNSFLKKSPIDGFAIFDDADLPTVSDIMFVLSQYLAALEKLRADNINVDFGTWTWNGTNIQTAAPKKIRG